MNIQNYLEKMAKIHTHLLNFLDDERNDDVNYQILIDIFSEMKIHDNRNEIKSLLYLLLKLSTNHHRSILFFNKIERILTIFKNDIKFFFSNSEIFHIFKGSKRILLFLLEENLLKIDGFITSKFHDDRYSQMYYPIYFLPEIKPFVNEEWYENTEKENLTEEFYKQRKEGEDEEYIMELIRKDSIDDFIVYVNKTQFPLDSEIYLSIHDTNNYLLKNYSLTLIKYAAFFGSIQIFKYLKLNKVKITPSLLLYAIHGRNKEIFHTLEECLNDLDEDEYDDCIKKCFKESIKCHHNEFASYIEDNYLSGQSDFKLINCIAYYNFDLIQNTLINESLFCYFCKYDYNIPVEIFIRENSDVINSEIIHIFNIKYNFK